MNINFKASTVASKARPSVAKALAPLLVAPALFFTSCTKPKQQPLNQDTVTITTKQEANTGHLGAMIWAVCSLGLMACGSTTFVVTSKAEMRELNLMPKEKFDTELADLINRLKETAD